MPSPLFVVRDNAVVVHRDPDPARLAEIREALYEVMGAQDGEIVLDLSPMGHVSSAMLGLAVGAHLRAEEAGRKLRVRISEHLVRILEVTMLNKVLSLEVVPAGGNERK